VRNMWLAGDVGTTNMALQFNDIDVSRNDRVFFMTWWCHDRLFMKGRL